MLSSYKYCVVIPHRNIPSLLVRCLQSVPALPYVHVLVVDNSEDDKKAETVIKGAPFGFGSLTVIERKPINIGYIRNEALRFLHEQHFVGKLVFADADDYFTTKATECFERFKDADYDMVWFGVRGEDEKGCPAPNADYVNRNLKVYEETNDLGALKYNDGPVWGKFIDMRLISRNDVWFQEIETCEDTLFSAMIGYYSQSQHVAPPQEVLYVYVQRKGSLVMINNAKKAKTGFQAAYDTTRWLKERTKDGYYWTQYNVIWHWINWCQMDWTALEYLPKVYELCDKKKVRKAIVKVFKRKIKTNLRQVRIK